MIATWKQKPCSGERLTLLQPWYQVDMSENSILDSMARLQRIAKGCLQIDDGTTLLVKIAYPRHHKADQAEVDRDDAR